LSGRRWRRAVVSTLGLGACLCLLLASETSVSAADGWLAVDYSELVDRRQLSHSGESVGALIERLEGRGAPRDGGRPQDRHAHQLLEPLLEPYAFVLSDALDGFEAGDSPDWIEIGSLWQPGEPQPAWVELLRARQLIVESDGRGRLRVILPWESSSPATGLPEQEARLAARAAWDAAWPVLRHVLAAEHRRLAAEDAVSELNVEAHAYRHLPQSSEFHLGTDAESIVVEDLRAAGLAPPLNLDRLTGFLSGGLRLEGARLEPDGGVRLLGSRTRTSPTLLGEPLGLADLAVAYRAVFHGGLAEPYMSLDRGYSPMRSVVNYGGRLRDTALGLVSLQCDIRFKTFSLGLDIEQGVDLRDRLRESLPGFRTHMEHLATHPDSAGMAGQQTRLWFYPDDVDLTISEQGDLVVLRKVRMSAASERLGETGLAAADQEVRPWTQATVDAINGSYDTLAGFFPEMADLDQVVRVLSLFAWLEAAGAEGNLVPELDSLLAVELPRLSTPRTYPQLLAFNALPPVGATDAVVVFDRVLVGEALDRLNPTSGRPLPARRRYQRAVGALTPSQAEDAALLREFSSYPVERLDDAQIDLLSQRAERLIVHRTVLQTLAPPRRRPLAQRLEAGEQLRMFSVGIGGLDLGMGPAVARARGRRVGLAGGGSGLARPASATAAVGSTTRDLSSQARDTWREDPPGLPRPLVPDHRSGESSPGAQLRVVAGRGVDDESFVLTIYGADSPDVRSRRVFRDGKDRVLRFERVEQQRLLRYGFEKEKERWVARPTDPADSPQADTGSAGALPPGLVLLQVFSSEDELLEPAEVVLRIEAQLQGSRRSLEAEVPRLLLQRLVQGREIDRAPGQPLAGLAPLPQALGEVRGLMVMADASRWLTPWDGTRTLLAGEEDPLRVARALGAWWSATDNEPSGAVIGVDATRSPERWAVAPRPRDEALLLLPHEGFDGPMRDWRAPLAAAWDANRVVYELPDESAAALVVLVSAEPPGELARRLRGLARDERMRGRLLAVWSLSGPVREDLPRSLIDEGQLAGIGIAEHSLVARRKATETIRAIGERLAAGPEDLRVEALPGPFLWHF